MNTLSYDSPAENIESSFILGNGRLGAFAYGGIKQEVIHIAEESVWDSVYKDRNNRNCAENIKKIHNLFAESKTEEADSLVSETMSGVPNKTSSLKNICSVTVDFYSGEERKNFENPSVYKRVLDLETAVASSSFSCETSVPSTAIFSRNTDGSSIMYSRELIVSACSDVMAFHVSASIPKSIYFRLSFNDSSSCSRQYSLGEDVIAIENVSGIPYCAMAMVAVSAGKVFVRGGYLVVEGADDATIYIDVETAFRNGHYFRKGGNIASSAFRMSSWCADKALRKLCFASHQPYQDFRSEHISEYSHAYKKTSLSLYGKDKEIRDLETDWNYARYILLSCSRAPGLLPALSKGNYSIKDCIPAIYSPVCMTGLKKTLRPLISLLQKAYKRGKRTAAVMYNCSGYVIHNSLDLWGDSVSSGDGNEDFAWIMGSAVLALYVREYYEYTLDKKFLRKNFYLLKDACEFYEDFIENYPNSPFINVGLVKNLFEATIYSANDLCVNDTKPDIVRLKDNLIKIKNLSDANISLENKELKADETDFLVNSALSLNDTTQKIVSSEYVVDGTANYIKINLLPDVEELSDGGLLKGACIKGNLKMNIEWNASSIVSARIYSKPATDYARNLMICYKGKEYKAELTEGSIDLRNVLPSTI